MPASPYGISKNTRPEPEAAPVLDPACVFARWSFDDGTEVVSRSIEIIDGIPVCIERWRMDRTIGESIVVPLTSFAGYQDADVAGWVLQRMAVADDQIAGRERGYFAIHHGFART